MTKIITLHNEKGGVGKSTLAVHIAAGLAVEGNRVVLIDTDPQGHSARLLGMPATSHIYDLLVRDAAWEDCLQSVPADRLTPTGNPRGNLYLCAANREAISITQNVQNIAALRERIAELEVDIVVIDTSPTPSMLNGIVFYASDGVILPTSTEPLGLDGLAKTAGTMQAIAANPALDIRLLGIQPNLYDKRKLEHQTAYDNIAARFGAFAWEPIPLRVAVTEASAVGKTVFAYDPGSDASNSLWELVDRVAFSMKETINNGA